MWNLYSFYHVCKNILDILQQNYTSSFLNNKELEEIKVAHFLHVYQETPRWLLSSLLCGLSLCWYFHILIFEYEHIEGSPEVVSFIHCWLLWSVGLKFSFSLTKKRKEKRCFFVLSDCIFSLKLNLFFYIAVCDWMSVTMYSSGVVLPPDFITSDGQGCFPLRVTLYICYNWITCIVMSEACFGS